MADRTTALQIAAGAAVAYLLYVAINRVGGARSLPEVPRYLGRDGVGKSAASRVAMNAGRLDMLGSHQLLNKGRPYFGTSQLRDPTPAVNF